LAREARRQEFAHVDGARGVGEYFELFGVLSKVEGAAGIVGERHVAVVARTDAERLAGAESACSEVNRVGAAMAVGSPPMHEDAAIRVRAGDFWCVEVPLWWGTAGSRVALCSEDE